MHKDAVGENFITPNRIPFKMLETPTVFARAFAMIIMPFRYSTLPCLFEKLFGRNQSRIQSAIFS